MKTEERPLTVVIVDDESPARMLLREYLAAHDDIRVVGECENGFAAVKAISELGPDLVLLDVQMPKLDGFEVLELLEHPPAVIFVTAYDEYALRAFEVHAVDYVLKPVGRDRIDTAIARAKERLANPITGPAARSLAKSSRPPGEHLQRVIVKDGPKVEVVPVARIDWIEAQDDYVAIHVAERSLLKNETLTEIADALDPSLFIRIHRSFVLNIERLARLDLGTKDSRIAVLKDGKTLPVSRAGYARLKERM